LIHHTSSPTPQNVALARSLKPAIQRFYTAHGSDDRFTKVTCALKAGATVGHCDAYFTSASPNESGWFAITATVNRTTGAVQWQATKAVCRDPKTAKTVAC
jgi:hypothetical protein